MAYEFALPIFTFLGPLDWINKALFNANGLGYHLGFSLKSSLFRIGCIHPVFNHCRISGIQQMPPEAVFHPENRNISDRARHGPLFFHARQQVCPREGYFLWIVGMLLAMFPAEFSPSGPDISQASSRT
jgi:hypothetical protein